MYGLRLLTKPGVQLALLWLLAIIVLAWIGLWPDPNPNPIGPGLLFFLTFWPAVVCMAIGAIQVWRRRRSVGSGG